MNLYDIEQEILDCMEEVDEETGELLNWERLDALVIERDRKIEGLACWIKNLKAKGEALKNEMDSLAKRRKAAENKAQQMKEYLSHVLAGQKFETSKVLISWRKSSSVEVPDIQELDEEYLTYKEPDINRTAIKQAIKSGVSVKGAYIAEKQNIQIK